MRTLESVLADSLARERLGVVLLVGFALARTAIDLHLVPSGVAYAGFAAIVCIEAFIVASFVLGRQRRPAGEAATR